MTPQTTTYLDQILSVIQCTGMLKNLGQDKILGDFQLEDKNDEVLIFFRVSDSFEINFKDFFGP